MRQLQLPIPPSLERCPELAPLAILDAAIAASESALLAACPDIQLGDAGRAQRGSTTLRANCLILQARRLAAAITAYRAAVDRDARRTDREYRRRSF